MTTETFTLSRPLKTHSGDITEITLKEPLAKSYFDHGEPYRARVISDDAGDRIEIDFFNNVFKKFLSDVTGLDDIVLSGMRAADYTRLRLRVTNMLAETAGSNPIEA